MAIRVYVGELKHEQTNGQTVAPIHKNFFNVVESVKNNHHYLK